MTGLVFGTLEMCTDCGGIVRNRDFYDPDNVENVAGIPPCNCRSQYPANRREHTKKRWAGI